MSRVQTPLEVQPPSRAWHAHLTLGFQRRERRTTLVDNHHFGPLRVQRPFYPEVNGCCHVYLLHPPGGMVVGDLLQINANLGDHAHALLTTPSAGKVYGVQGASTVQRQQIQLRVADGACAEWLPQETLVFEGANARLSNQLHLNGQGRALIWDMVCLGRPAAGERFNHGRCDQSIEVRRDGRLLLMERNRFFGGDGLLQAPWGLKGCNTVGTLVATVAPTREQVDNMLTHLQKKMPNSDHHWGLTQKGELFIARYIGNSALFGRKGFEFIWQALRPLLNGTNAVEPRIWRT